MDRRTFTKVAGAAVIGGVGAGIASDSKPKPPEFNHWKAELGAESYVMDCYIVPHRNQEFPMFDGQGDKAIVRLKDYAIIPMDMFKDIIEKATGKSFDRYIHSLAGYA